MSTGWEQRLAILRRDAEDKILGPLRTHGWTSAIEREVQNGEYLLIKAERGGQSHRVAIMYTSATKNAVYKSLAPQVEHIFINGDLYKLESYACGIDTPVSTADEFQIVLVDQYRAICVALLYALSIVVRYRPSVWRRVQEGDLDHLRVLIEAFLAVVERVLPEQFLEKVSGQRVVAKQPGALW